MKLSDHASDTYSQFGEDGMINHIFSLLKPGKRVCVEFGAADGTSCSNTAALWRNGWTALLIEGNKDLYQLLNLNLGMHRKNCHTINTVLTPIGPCTVDNAMSNTGITDVDFMSIDVDGIDYLIWEHMAARPRVVCIEYNQSIPPHVSIHQTMLDDRLGSSAKALIELGERKGYEFIGMNKANLFFVVKEEAKVFNHFTRDLAALFPYEGLSYAGTDYRGRSFVIGSPPWGMADEPYIGEVEGDSIHIVGNVFQMISALEKDYGHTAVFIGQDWEVSPSAETTIGVVAYRRLFGSNYPLVILDVANQSDIEGCRWVEVVAKEFGYGLRIVRRDLFVFTKAGVA